MNVVCVWVCFYWAIHTFRYVTNKTDIVTGETLISKINIGGDYIMDMSRIKLNVELKRK